MREPEAACLVEVKCSDGTLDTCGRSRGRIPFVSAVRRAGGRRVRAGNAAECGGMRRSAECCDLFTPAALRLCEGRRDVKVLLLPRAPRKKGPKVAFNAQGFTYER